MVSWSTLPKSISDEANSLPELDHGYGMDYDTISFTFNVVMWNVEESMVIGIFHRVKGSKQGVGGFQLIGGSGFERRQGMGGKDNWGKEAQKKGRELKDN